MTSFVILTNNSLMHVCSPLRDSCPSGWLSPWCWSPSNSNCYCHWIRVVDEVELEQLSPVSSMCLGFPDRFLRTSGRFLWSQNLDLTRRSIRYQRADYGWFSDRVHRYWWHEESSPAIQYETYDVLSNVSCLRGVPVSEEEKVVSCHLEDTSPNHTYILIGFLLFQARR